MFLFFNSVSPTLLFQDHLEKFIEENGMERYVFQSTSSLFIIWIGNFQMSNGKVLKQSQLFLVYEELN